MPIEAVNRGQQRCVEDVELSPEVPTAQASAPTTAPDTVIPKLRARVRFPSPAPPQSPRPAARGLFVVRAVPNDSERRLPEPCQPLGRRPLVLLPPLGSYAGIDVPGTGRPLGSHQPHDDRPTGHLPTDGPPPRQDPARMPAHALDSSTHQPQWGVTTFSTTSRGLAPLAARSPAHRRADVPVFAPLRPGRRSARGREPQERRRRGGGRLHDFRQPPWGEPRRSGAHFGLLRAG